jgi:hypothetical protein
MTKIIHSVRDARRGVTIQKQPEAGVGQLRCGKCQGMCTSQLLGDGTKVMKCGGCGANYTITAMDGPKPPRPGEVPRRVPR